VRVAADPCESCPYRQDVPSGVWSAEEYDKLPEYDKPTAYQPLMWFGCHARPNLACHGWAVVHGSQQGEYALLARRVFPFKIPTATVSLFASGAQAARHGKARLKHPGKRARELMLVLLDKYSRLREANAEES
jgi:hypothetical protein